MCPLFYHQSIHDGFIRRSGVADDPNHVTDFGVIRQRFVGALDLRKVRFLDFILGEYCFEVVLVDDTVVWDEVVLTYIYHVCACAFGLLLEKVAVTRYYRVILSGFI
ncbi:hypothetical protein GCM10022627_24250 [Haloarcula argentinensis]